MKMRLVHFLLRKSLEKSFKYRVTRLAASAPCKMGVDFSKRAKDGESVFEVILEQRSSCCPVSIAG